MGVSIAELEKAHASLITAQRLLSEAVAIEPKNDDLCKALRDSCILRFEFCIELAWKTSVRVLGLQTHAPRQAIREMAQNSLIPDTQAWFDFLDARNKTSHSYDEDVAQEVYQSSLKLASELDSLLTQLRAVK